MLLLENLGENMKIMAYGSLMNQNSLEKTLSRSVKLTKIIVPGYGRVFDAPFGKYAYLNLRESPGRMEAALFEMEERELIKFDEREAGSKLIEIMPGILTFIWPDAYCRRLPVLRDYIDICAAGASRLSVDIWRNTELPNEIIDVAGQYSI